MEYINQVMKKLGLFVIITQILAILPLCPDRLRPENP